MNVLRLSKEEMKEREELKKLLIEARGTVFVVFDEHGNWRLSTEHVSEENPGVASVEVKKVENYDIEELLDLVFEAYESYINVFERKIPYEEWVKEAKK